MWKREFVRYYCIANDTAYEYELLRIKDKMKEVIGYQFKRDVSLQELFIFDTTTGREV